MLDAIQVEGINRIGLTILQRRYFTNAMIEIVEELLDNAIILLLDLYGSRCHLSNKKGQ